MKILNVKSVGWVIFNVILLSLVSIIPEEGLSADNKIIMNADQNVRRAFSDKSSGWWILSGRGSVIQKYDINGGITAGFDISSYQGALLAKNERRTLYDITQTREGNICALVGAVQPQSHEIGSYIMRYGSADINPEIILLEKKIAAYKIGIDSLGNYFVLGLDDSSFWKIQREHISGTYMILHKFSEKGGYLGSFMPVAIDASSDDSRTRELTSPMHQAGNFVVCANGDAWILWHSYPAQGSLDGLRPRLFKIDSKGINSLFQAKSPLDGAFLYNLVQHAESRDVLLEWRNGNGLNRTEAILATPAGEVYIKGDFPGRVMSVSSKEVVISGKGLVEGKVSVVSQSVK